MGSKRNEFIDFLCYLKINACPDVNSLRPARQGHFQGKSRGERQRVGATEATAGPSYKEEEDVEEEPAADEDEDEDGIERRARRPVEEEEEDDDEDEEDDED